MPPAFPEKLDRLPYLYRWLALSGTAAVLFYLILSVAMHSKLEALVLVPSAGWFIVKMLYLDTARLRSIGWSPILSLLNLFPPVAVFLQLLLFLLSPMLVAVPVSGKAKKQPIEVRILTPADSEVLEEWEHVTSEPDILGVSAAKLNRPKWKWQVSINVAEFVREEPLEGRLEKGITTALRNVRGVSDVAREDREVWVLQGEASGEALVRACAITLDQLAPDIRKHLEILEFKWWTERVAQVRVGMHRAEVERILPPTAMGYRTTTRTGGAQGVQYAVAPGYWVTIFYDYTGVPRDSKGEALSHESPENRVIEAPKLEQRSVEKR